MKQVVIGILGQPARSSVDIGRSLGRPGGPPSRICQHEELLIDRFELLYDKPSAAARRGCRCRRHHERLAGDRGAAARAPAFAIRGTSKRFTARCTRFARAYPFRPDREHYLVNITTGTHVQQICLFLLAESRHIPGKLLQASPPRRKQVGRRARTASSISTCRVTTISRPASRWSSKKACRFSSRALKHATPRSTR